MKATAETWPNPSVKVNSTHAGFFQQDYKPPSRLYVHGAYIPAETVENNQEHLAANKVGSITELV